jgi:hypothetical protein
MSIQSPVPTPKPTKTYGLRARGLILPEDHDLIRVPRCAQDAMPVSHTSAQAAIEAANGFDQAHLRLQAVRPAPRTKQRHAVTTDAAMPAEVDPFLAARLRLQHQAVN